MPKEAGDTTADTLLHSSSSSRHPLAAPLHPSGLVSTAVLLCQPGEETEAQCYMEAVLEDAPYEHLSTFVAAPEDEFSQKWGPQRLFVPHRAAIVGSASPLIPLQCLKFTKSIYFSPFFVVALVAGAGLPVWATRAGNEDNYWWMSTTGISLVLVTMTLQCSMYSRAILRQLMGSFEFWFLSMQVMIISACTSFLYYKEKGDWATIPLRTGSDLVMMFAILAIDASNVSRWHKGVVMTIMTIATMVWAFLWNRDRSDPAVYRIDIYVLDVSVRSVAQGCLATLAAFCFKYACAALFMKHDAMMLKFAPRLVRLEDVHLVDHHNHGHGHSLGRQQHDSRADGVAYAPPSPLQRRTNENVGTPNGGGVDVRVQYQDSEGGDDMRSNPGGDDGDVVAPSASAWASSTTSTSAIPVSGSPFSRGMAGASSSDVGTPSSSTFGGGRHRSGATSASSPVPSSGATQLSFGKNFRISRHFQHRGKTGPTTTSQGGDVTTTRTTQLLSQEEEDFSPSSEERLEQNSDPVYPSSPGSASATQRRLRAEREAMSLRLEELTQIVTRQNRLIETLEGKVAREQTDQENSLLMSDD